MNKADIATAKEKDLFSRSPFLEVPMMFITSDEEVIGEDNLDHNQNQKVCQIKGIVLQFFSTT